MAMVQTLSVGLAFCFLLNLLGSAVPAKHRSDLVYCPLQKAWVEGSRQKVETARVDLDDICAADKLKSTFLLAISSRIKIETSADDDSFFNFIRSGVIGPGSPTLPGTPQAISEFNATPKVATQNRSDKHGTIEQLLTLTALSRPPTIADEPDFTLPIGHVLRSEIVSGPSRAPPIS